MKRVQTWCGGWVMRAVRMMCAGLKPMHGGRHSVKWQQDGTLEAKLQQQEQQQQRRRQRQGGCCGAWGVRGNNRGGGLRWQRKPSLGVVHAHGVTRECMHMMLSVKHHE